MRQNIKDLVKPRVKKEHYNPRPWNKELQQQIEDDAEVVNVTEQPSSVDVCELSRDWTEDERSDCVDQVKYADFAHGEFVY